MTEKRSNEVKTKEWPTLLVASAVTGVAMDKMTYADIQNFTSWVLDRSVWTHELVHEPTISAMRESVYEQFPDLPKTNEAEADWMKARDGVIDRYGPTLLLKQSEFERQETPIDTLKTVAPHVTVIPITKSDS